MKRTVIKDWVFILLGVINMLMFCIMGSDCDSLSIFMISHIIAAVIFVINGKVMLKYGKSKWFSIDEEE